MLFTLQESICLLGISAFEILSLLIGSITFSLTAMLNAEQIISSWVLSFIPLFICIGANWYFITILLIRNLKVIEDKEDASKTIRSFMWSLMTIVVQLATCVMFALKLEKKVPLAHAEVFAPIFVYLGILIIYSCVCCYKKQRQEFV